MAKKPSKRKVSQPSRANGRRPTRSWNPSWDPHPERGGGPGSGSGLMRRHCKFIPKGYPVPIHLTVRFDAPLKGGTESARLKLNQPAKLTHAHDPSFACCWFSRIIDLGEDGENPACWMLQKKDKETWTLCLRRVSGELAEYRIKSKAREFPVKLKKQGRSSREFKWPASVTIS